MTTYIGILVTFILIVSSHSVIARKMSISNILMEKSNLNIIVNKDTPGTRLINLSQLTYNILNSNTSIESLNNLTTSFDETVNSPGWTALDTFINTVGNSFATYDAVGNGIQRYIDRSRRKKAKKQDKRDEKEDEEEEIIEEIKSSGDDITSNLASIEMKLKCRLLKLATKRKKGLGLVPLVGCGL